jgi:hypothetical protein
LNAAHFGYSTITAPSIGTMTIKGDKRNGIAGDCAAEIDLSGAGVETNQFTLGTLHVSGEINEALINIEDGNVGSIAASRMVDSILFVGYTPDTDDPFAGGEFTPDLLLKTVSISSSSNGFDNSYIAAPIIGNVRFGSVSTNNAGVEFGVVVGQSMTSLTVRTPPFKWSRRGATDQSVGDFHVVLP